MLNSKDMFDALNVSSVTSAIGTYGSAPALWGDILIPKGFIGKSINFYVSASYDLRREYIQGVYTINCRAATHGEAEAIAKAVISAVNRTSYSTYYIGCQILPVIPPADETDNYNCIVEAILKKK